MRKFLTVGVSLFFIWVVSFFFFSPVFLADDISGFNFKKGTVLFISRFDAMQNKMYLGNLVIFRGEAYFEKVGVVLGFDRDTDLYTIYSYTLGALEIKSNNIIGRVVYPKEKINDFGKVMDYYSSYDEKKEIAKLSETVVTLKREVEEKDRRISELTQSLSPIEKEHQEFWVEKSGWVRLNSNLLGISLDYPFKSKGIVEFEYFADQTNDHYLAQQSYGWRFFKDGEGQGIGAGGDFLVGAVSKDFHAGRDVWFTDFYELGQADLQSFVQKYKTKYGTDAVLKKTPISFPEYGPDPGDLGMTIYANLPIKKDPRFKGIAVYSPNGFTLEEAQRIVNSLTVSE